MSITRLSGGNTPADGADPRTFPTIFNDAADQIEAKVDSTGGTMTGALVTPDVGLEVTAGTADTIALDFSAGDAFVSRTVSGTAVTVTGSNYTPGRTRTIRFTGGAADASLTVPGDWTFVGQSVATTIGSAVTGILSATSFGTVATDVVAAWAEEA